MVPLTGYADKVSGASGDRIAFKVSSQKPGPCTASLVRIIHADPNPAGPGMKIEDLSPVFSTTFDAREQAIEMGSYVRVDGATALSPLGTMTISVLVFPTLPDAGDQCVIARWDPDTATGFALLATADGFAAEIGRIGAPTLRVVTGKKLRSRAWYRVWLIIDPAARSVRLGQTPLRAEAGWDDAGEAWSPLDATLAHDARRSVFIGAQQARPSARHFNGRIEDPVIVAGARREIVEQRLEPTRPPLGTLAAWDFSRGIDTLDVEDIGPNHLHGVLINLPTRAVTGSAWTGRAHRWTDAPRDYAAIHFHADDLDDCRWSTDFSFTIPASLRSGIYGMRLKTADSVDTIPFYVRPQIGKPTAKIAVLASSFTHQVYTNHMRNQFDEAFRARMTKWGASPSNPDEYPQYGRSTYNFHLDRSGVCYSSRLRPQLTIRPGFLTFNDEKGSGLRHFPADTHLADWLEKMGIAFDVITDEDLDDLGLDLIKPYACLVTGSHPEYHTPGTLDAIQAYVDGGGRLAYLGGNGFYWKVARSARLPGTLEIRRVGPAIRTWAAEPGEHYNALDGALGGLWRHNGRPPQRLAGVGFSGQGRFEGSYYRRLPASSDPRVAWIFDGVGDEILGDFGLSGGGAAGFELDRADVLLGTPRNAIVVASSEKHQSHFVPVPEDLLGIYATTNGEPADRLIRADMTYMDVASGGAVFSTGSITFCGSLSHANYDNNVSRILFNVLNRFGGLGLGWPLENIRK